MGGIFRPKRSGIRRGMRKQDVPQFAPGDVIFIIQFHYWGNYAVVTQLGECKTEDLEVAGSSPAHGTMFLPNACW